jgi:exodeoxyribonuclease VII small subunit
MPKTSPKNPKSYKEMSAELANVLAWFDEADIDLDEAVKKYEQASLLLDEMENYLKTAENKIKKIKTKNP